MQHIRTYSILCIVTIVLISRNNTYSQDNYSFFSKRFKEILNTYPTPLQDTDGDGIDDIKEAQLKTNPEEIDTDGDGLDDYLEVFKYKTNPLKRDSDKDGLLDSVWKERYEYSYVLRIIARIGKPYDVNTLSSFNLDARLLEIHPDYLLVEYIIYPAIEPYLAPLRYNNNLALHQEYLSVDSLTMLSGNQLVEVKKIIEKANSDLERTILLIQYLWENYELKDGLFSQTEPLMEITVGAEGIKHIHKGFSPKKLYQKYTFREVMNYLCISNEMVKLKSRGSCGSTATLVASLFKNAGIPVRIKQNVPYITDKDSSQVMLINEIRSRDGILKRFRKGMYGDNHFFNEIFINGYWIDLDTYRLGNKWQNRPYLKTIHFNNWSDVDFANSWEPWIQFDKTSAKSLDIRYKAYKTLSIEEIFPVNK